MQNTYLILSFVLGTIIGSFLNALEYRMSSGLKIGGGARSMCPKCKSQLKWFHNIPVLSFFFLFGKCGFCKKKISWQYPLVEFALGCLFALSFWFAFDVLNIYFSGVLVLMYFFVVSVLVFLFVYDLKHTLIPDRVVLPAIVLVLLFQLVLNVLSPDLVARDYILLLVSGIIGGGWFLWQFLVSRGRWVGGGDIRLGFLMGVVLGMGKVVLALGLAYVVGTIVSVPLLLLKKKTMKSEIAFGVFLVPATLVSLFWGSEIIAWYLSLIY